MATTAHAYGTQSDAYAAENDVIPRTSEKGRKVSLGKAPSEGALNDSDDLLAAIDLHRLHGFSIWDALVVRAALVSRCRVLYTEDLQHGQRIDGLEVVNPFVPFVS